VAANYLLGTFDGSGDAPSVGIIEMGGGSTQVSFQVDASARVAEIDSFVFRTSLGRRYHLYAHSYLGYGQDYAQAKLRDQLPRASPTDPCYPKGYTRQSGESATISGGGNASGCAAAIQAALFQAPADAPGRYAGEQPLTGKFLATQNFFFGRRDLGLPMFSGARDMEEASQTACAKKVELPSKDPGQPNTCFGLSYQLIFLRSLGLASRPPGVSVEIANAVKGGDVDWALGAALVHILEAKEEGQAGGASGPSWIGLVVAFAAAPLLFVLARAVWPRVQGRSLKRHQSPGATTVGKAGMPAE